MFRDHPRSRGVYGVPCAAGGVSGGSSPLARGLPSCPIRALISLGIIPARAGFTAHERERSCPGSDHPRSRGVYAFTWRMQTSPVGSSPLARGLRLRVRDRRAEHGIIPARAGFTYRCVNAKGQAQDHPRSRGVYKVGKRWETIGYGSSPLARGLPEVAHTRFGSFGIIPARAEFTGANILYCGSIADHPRSRGVYKVGKRWETIGYGSSPLARGLLNCVRGDSVICGIIPARAGFTLCGTRIMSSRRDHPRSRGVYLCSPCAP